MKGCEFCSSEIGINYYKGAYMCASHVESFDLEFRDLVYERLRGNKEEIVMPDFNLEDYPEEELAKALEAVRKRNNDILREEEALKFHFVVRAMKEVGWLSEDEDPKRIQVVMTEDLGEWVKYFHS